MIVYVNRLSVAIGGSYLSGNDLQEDLQMRWDNVARILLLDQKWLTAEADQIPSLENHRLVMAKFWNVEGKPDVKEILRIGARLRREIISLCTADQLTVILGQDSLVWLISYLKERISGIRIATYHQGTPTHCLDELSDGVKEAFLEELQKADFILTVSPYLTKQLSAHFAKPIITIPNLPKVRSIRRGTLHRDETRLKVLQVSSYRPRKRALDGIFLMKHLNDIGIAAELTYVGAGDRSAEFLSHLDENLTIKAIPYVPYHEIADIISSHDILFVPSRREGFPRVVVEALSVGTPVLISTDANACGIIKDLENGFVFQTGDMRDALSKLQYFLSGRSDLAQRIVRSGQNSVIKLRKDRQSGLNKLAKIVYNHESRQKNTWGKRESIGAG